MLIALGYALEFTVLAGLRMAYPYELEWIEGAYVDEVFRVMQGDFPYGPPSITFIPTSKTPVFFYLSAGLMKLLGVGFLAPRLISILSTLGCFVLLAAIIHHNLAREKLVQQHRFSRWMPGILAAGIYAASFRFTGAWMDLAKTDSLFLFLILAAFYTCQRARTFSGSLASGALFALAYFTKQLTLPVVLVLAPVSLLASRGGSWLRWSAAGVIGLAAFAALDIGSDGWFSFYTFDTVTTHAWQPDFWLFWRLFLPMMGPALVLTAIYGFTVLRTTIRQNLDAPSGDWECLGLGAALILASWSVFIKAWTYDNGLMLASLGVALLAGLGAAHFMDAGEPSFIESAGRTGLKLPLHAAAMVILLLQFGLLLYNPAEQIPTAAHRSDAEAFIEQIAGLPGEVLVFNHGFVNYQAGKTSYLHSSPYGDVVGSAAEPGSDTAIRREAVLNTFNQAIAGQHFDWIVLDKPEASWLPYYVYVSELSSEFGDVYPVTGARTRPESLMARNPVARGGELPLDNDLYASLFLAGWDQPQSGERWAVGRRSMIQVALERGDYRMTVEVRPACTHRSPVVAELNAGWNGASLGLESFASCVTRRFSFDLSQHQVEEGFNVLWFEFSNGPGYLDGGGQSGNSDQEKGSTDQLAAFHSITFSQK